MAQKGDIRPDELEQKMQERLKAAAENSAKVIKGKNAVAEAQQEEHEEKKKLSRVEQARQGVKGIEDSARGVGQVKFWCILHTVDGEAYLHEGHWKINEIPTAANLLQDKAVLGEYNPATIKRISIFRTLKEAEVAAAEIKTAREEKENRQAAQIAKTLAAIMAGVAESKK